MSATGDLWRALDEGDDARLAEALEAFPEAACHMGPRIGRRQLLALAGASLGLAGLAGCRKAEKIVPQVIRAEGREPGVPEYFATVLPSEGTGQGHGIGAVVTSREGRPVKVEGNPDHPSSLGATDAVMQAACLALFDPARARGPRLNGTEASPGRFLADVARWRETATRTGGQGTAVLVGEVTAPTLVRQLGALRRAFPRLRLYRHASLDATACGDAAGRLAGHRLDWLPRLDRARVIVSLDDDVLAEGPGRLAHARAFAAGRRVRQPGDPMSRLWMAESTPTLTGARADHRIALRPSALPGLAVALEAAVAGESPDATDWLAGATADLIAAGPDALVLAGPQAHPSVAEAALTLNARLGGLGRTLDLIPPPARPEADGDLADLVVAIRAGEVTHVVSLTEDPLSTAPGDLDAEAAFGTLERLWHLGLWPDRTATLAEWHLPAAHALESWGDLVGHDGTVALQQPLIAPLYQGRTPARLVAQMLGVFDPDDRAEVAATHGLDEDAFRAALRRGTVAGTAAAPVQVTLTGSRSAAPAAGQGIEVRFTPDPWLRDGSLAPVAVLQELPRPLTKQVWGNAVLIAPADAARLGLDTGDSVTLTAGSSRVGGATMVVPGHPAGSVTVALGHGRTGPVAGMGQGFDAFRLRPGAAWARDGATLEPTGARLTVLTTQHHHAMEGRDPVRRATLAAFRDDPRAPHAGHPPPPDTSLYPAWDTPREAWGMSVDLTACFGCMACVSACAAENNTPVVGPEECGQGHEMHWLRVDRYYEGPPEAPETHFQPVPCMQCENAPCEVVCPVNATVHTHDGLNAQVYNRCVGTRYCSQNCPYKVRRFNFRDYTDFKLPGPEAAARNPEVTVRSRGVMEKCTYCVQRIAAARIAADVAGEAPIADGAVQTACQQACPAEAIHFGNLNDPGAAVVAEKASPLTYGLLEELNTRPRTTYLAALRNPKSGGHHG